MTKKRYLRFESSMDYLYCVDTATNQQLTSKDMLDKLNKQDELIKELEKEVESKQRVIDAYEQYVKDLKEDGDGE